MTELKPDVSERALIAALFREEGQHLIATVDSEEMLRMGVGRAEEILAEQMRDVCKRVFKRYQQIVQVQTKVDD